MTSIITDALNTLGPTNLALTAAAIGFIAYPVIKKICSVALMIFSSLREWVSKRTFVVRLHSLVCDECAQNHKKHMYETPIEQI